MTISRVDVTALLRSDIEDAVLVLVRGRTQVVSAGDLAGDEHAGALRVASKAEVGRELAGETDDRRLDEVAARLDAEVSTLGA